MMETPNDNDLLVAGDEQSAFRILYEKYWQPLYYKALSRLGDDADAQDAVQEVFISCWRNKATIQIRDSLSPYLFTALKYCIIKKVYRKGKKGLETPLSIHELERTELSGDELLQYKELQSVILKEVERLPERMKEVYRLSRVDNLQIAEIAQQLQITEQTVKNTLGAALKKLRVRLSQYASLLSLLSFFF